MKEQWEKECADLRAELAALQKKLHALETKQGGATASAPTLSRWRLSKSVMVVVLPVVALLAAGGVLYGQGAVDALFIDQAGKVGIGTTTPNATLDLAGTLNVTQQASLADTTIKGTLTTEGNVGIGAPVPKGILDVRGHALLGGLSIIDSSGQTFSENWIGMADNILEKTKWLHIGGIKDGGERRLALFADTTYASGNVGIGTTKPKAKLDVNGVVQAKGFASTNPLRNRMYPADPIVYQDIFDAKEKQAIRKLGSFTSYNETSHKQNLWNDRQMIKFGGNNETDGNGAEVTIPAGYDTVWVRVLGERWNVIHAYFTDGDKEDLGQWTGGRRSANSYSPDGALSDGYKVHHQWLPIPAGRAGKLALISKANTNDDFWISGLAFSKNPWAHATQSAIGYHWAVNGGEQTQWDQENWNGDSLSKINPKTNLELKVPVVPSGHDKLLYLIEHNSNWNGSMHTGITVNGRKLERFMATYDSPFARHWNSKSYERYIAARIPVDFIDSKARYLSVRIDMSKQDDGINFREIGTHDLDVPWGE